MLAPLNRMLENISVRAKLTLGFGIVMLLTLLIATTGWLGIQALGERSDRILDIAKLNDLTRDVRNGRLFYSINPDAERAAAVVKLLDDIDSQLAHDRLVFHSQASLPLLETANTVAKSYRAHFNDFSQAVQARDATRAVFGGHADAAVAQLKKLMETATSPSGDQAQIDSLVKAQTLVQQARFQLRGYSYSLKSELQKPARDAIADAIAYIQTLTTRLPASMTADVQGLQQAMSNYRDTVALFAEAQAKADSAQVQIDGDIKNLLATTQQLAQDQIDQRQDDVLDARNLLAGALLAAMLLGIFAAWTITRLIVGPLMETLRRAEQVANGNLSDNTVVSRRDELGQLQLSMQRMILNLRELIGGLRDGVVRISGAAEQLSAITEQTRNGVNNQRQETDQVATAMNEMDGHRAGSRTQRRAGLQRGGQCQPRGPRG
ncbi:HAMP domain-containing methyl-accepting chemotaxis protein [Pseudomonas asplenii]|uniref:HAMP domain-containing methyl-accepting chemotaxis protein n=1 Tax=Pseudomonas asplenii TaxID=53407 RepID=UPI003B430449